MRLTLAALLLGSAAIAQTTPAASTTYRDDGLKFTFTLRPEFVERPANDAAVASKAQRAGDLSVLLHCVTTPFTAVRHLGEHQVEVVTIVHIDFGCMGRLGDRRLLLPVARSAIEHSLERVGMPMVKPAVPYTLGGRDAIFLQGSAADVRDGIPGYSGVACVLLVNTIACWSALTAYPSHLAPLFASPVAFAGGASMALVPAGTVLVPAENDPH